MTDKIVKHEIQTLPRVLNLSLPANFSIPAKRNTSLTQDTMFNAQ